MLSDTIRLKIIKLLVKNEMNVSDIIDNFNVDQPLISHKLKELRENGLVKSYRSGKNIIYRISDKSIINVIKNTEKAGNIIEKICECAECD